MENFKPLQPKNVELDKLAFPCGVQKKYDGEKLININGKSLSRRLKPIRNEWLTAEMQDIMRVFDIPLEGEVQVNGTFADTAGLLNSSNREGDFTYWVFDTPMPDTPYEERQRILHNAVTEAGHPRVRMVQTKMVYDVEGLLQLHAEYDADPALDGTITRNMQSEYKTGRATLAVGHVMKLKSFDDSEAIITGFTERMHNTNPAQTNELGRTERSSAQDGLVPTGLLAAYEADWNGVPIIVTATGDLPSREFRWKNKEELYGKFVKFQHQGFFPDTGKPRFPTELALRDEADMGAPEHE